MKKLFLFFISLFSWVSQILAQTNAEPVNTKLTIRAYVGIPRVISSRQFNEAFNGRMESGVSANLRVVNNAFVGIGFHYSTFVIEKAAWSAPVSGTNGALFYKTTLINQGVNFKIGFDREFSKIGYTSVAFNAGYMMSNYTKINPDTLVNSTVKYKNANLPRVPTSFNAPYIQPEISFNFRAEKSASFSLLLSYTTLFYKFDPKAPRYAQVGEIADASNRHYISWVNIGLGCNILLGKK